MTERAVVVRPRATQDILEILTTISADNPEAADRFESATRREFELLRAFPGIGRARGFRTPALRGVRSRAISGFGNWLVYYLFHPESVEVVRVLHGARDVPRALAH